MLQSRLKHHLFVRVMLSRDHPFAAKLCVVRHATTTASSSSGSSSSIGLRGPATCPTSNTAPHSEVYATFQRSVAARTVGNNALRKYIEHCSANEINDVEAAIAGSKSSGLRVDAKTNEVFLIKLIEAGRVKSALDLHNQMTSQDRITPTSEAYNVLMRLCLDRDMSSSVLSLFDDMQKRGRSPNVESYELAISAMATENPPKWERAVQLFDKITHDRTQHVTARTYNALMRVYLTMTPFDWRVVYNCYYELRQQHPQVALSWESYDLVKEAFDKGRAGRIRRILTFVDAWFVLTHIKTVEFWLGVALFVCASLIIKAGIGYVVAHSSMAKDVARKIATESISGQ